jgi:hypothetical protein
MCVLAYSILDNSMDAISSRVCEYMRNEHANVEVHISFLKILIKNSINIKLE